MRILRAADYRVTPWKNGGGETAEIAAGPDGAGLEEFDWRVSMAAVASDGPFSRFDGIDRTLTVIDGAGLLRAIRDADPVPLTPVSAPLSFAGDVPTRASLIGGAVRDFNVMTRRGRYHHEVRRIQVQPGESVGVDVPGFALLFCCAGSLVLEEAGTVGTLARLDAAIVTGAAEVTLSGGGALLVAWIRSEHA